MDETQTTTENIDSGDPWAAAFAALNQAEQKDIEGTEDERDGGDTGASADSSAPDGQGSDHAEGSDSDVASENIPGPGDARGETDEQNAGDTSSSFAGVSISPNDYIKEVSERLVPGILDKVFNDFKNNGEHINSNGKLGWSINDPEIRQVDADGAVTFINPETKREFSGDDPRRQAQEYVDWRNDQMRNKFNQACEAEQNKQLQQFAPQFNLLRFAPTYQAMDPIRQQLFDAMLEGYEVTDANGNVIGYSCDLEKMNNLMERQISTIQAYGQKTGQVQKPAASGPALDMKADHSGNRYDGEPPKDLNEAMERLQNKQLEEYRAKHDRRK